MKQAINGLIYDTEKAIVLARTDDDMSYECYFNRTMLYRTEKGNYFKSTEPAFFNESRKITPLEVHQAVKEYNKLSVQLVDFEQAFPDMLFREA
jgi:hypothetical protein